MKMGNETAKNGKKGIMRGIYAGLFFFVIAIVATWPLALYFKTLVPAGSNDLYQNLWGFWWWRTAIFDHHVSPFFTNMLYAPEGLDLAFHTHSIFNMLITFGVNILWGYIAAYNTAVFIAVFLCGLGAYLLVFELTGDNIAAFGGGIVYALFPQHLEQLFEHLNLFSCQFIPFTLLFLIRTFRHGKMKDGLLTGFFFGLNALASWHLGLLLVLIGLPCLVRYAWKSECRAKAFGWLSLGGVLCFIMLIPFLWPMVKTYVAGDAYFVKPKVFRPVDPAFLVIPPPQGTIIGNVTKGIYLSHRGTSKAIFKSQYAGFICFLGWTPLLLVLFLFYKAIKDPQRAEKLFWLFLFLAFLILSFGTHLLFFGKEYKGFSLPQLWLQKDPKGGILDPVFLFFRVMRVSNRYLIPASLAFAVLSAMGISCLKKKALRWTAVSLIFLEFLWIPFPLKALPINPHLKELSKTPGVGIVLDIPPCSEAAHVDNMLRQTVHGAPLIGGYAACVSPEKKKYLFDLLKEVYIRKQPPMITPRFIDKLKRKGIGTIIVRPLETREACIKEKNKRIKNGELPFFIKDLRPIRFFPKQQLERLVDGLYRFLGKPDYESKKLLIWHLGK